MVELALYHQVTGRTSWRSVLVPPLAKVKSMIRGNDISPHRDACVLNSEESVQKKEARMNTRI